MIFFFFLLVFLNNRKSKSYKKGVWVPLHLTSTAMVRRPEGTMHPAPLTHVDVETGEDEVT